METANRHQTDVLVTYSNGKGNDMDPRTLMARVYRELHNDEIKTAEFEAEINNCTGPDDAIEICWRYLKISA
jgi:hypothetical protein